MHLKVVVVVVVVSLEAGRKHAKPLNPKGTKPKPVRLWQHPSALPGLVVAVVWLDSSRAQASRPVRQGSTLGRCTGQPGKLWLKAGARGH